MPKPVEPLRIELPGSLGIATDTIADVDSRHAAELVNTVNDSRGRIAARKGWTDLTTSGHAAVVEQLHDHEVDATTRETHHAADLKIYKGQTTFTRIDDIAGAGMTAPSANNWQFHNFLGLSVGVQQGHEMIVYDSGGSAAKYQDISYFYSGSGDGSASTLAGSPPQGNCALVAFGRLFAVDADRYTIKWPVLGDLSDWSSAGSGQLDTRGLWPDGMDQIVALALWQNRLIVFGRAHFLIFAGLDDPNTNLQFSYSSSSNGPVGLEDAPGPGLVDRDLWVSVGKQLFYMSPDGLRDIGRTLVQQSQPISQRAASVRDQLVDDINTRQGLARMAYSEEEGFILARIGDDRYWCFDVKTERVKPHKWVGNDYSAVMRNQHKQLLFGHTGVLGLYSGYLDDSATYDFGYTSVHVRASEVGLVVWKHGLVSVTAQGQMDFVGSWSHDYVSDSDAQIVRFSGGDEIAQWAHATTDTPAGTGEWSVGEWSGGRSQTSWLRFDLSGEGAIIQFSIRATINQYPVRLNVIELYGKRAAQRRNAP